MNYRSSSMVAWMVGLLLMASSCGGDEAAALGKYNEECVVLEDCAAEFVCIQKRCTIKCSGDADCKAFDSKGTCGSGTGYCGSSCEITADCPPGLECVNTQFGTPTCGFQ